jgi:hypothetical protein
MKYLKNTFRVDFLDNWLYLILLQDEKFEYT